MNFVTEDDRVRTILERADQIFSLPSGYKAVAIESCSYDINGKSFEGTLLYVPGITYKELKEACDG